MRTTLDIDGSVLDELRRRQRQQGGTLGRLVSELLARALAAETGPTVEQPLQWTSRPMGARVDLEDTEAVQHLLDADR